MKKMFLISLTFILIQLRIISSNSLLNTFDTDDFETLRAQDDLFVDKSLLINEYLDYLDNYTVPILVRPEGWGKSTNLDMLRTFFEIEVDDKGEPLPIEKRKNPILFTGGDYILSSNNLKKLEPLKIASYEGAMQHMGKQPVILVKLKNATGDTLEEVEQNLKLCISQAFQRHKYLLQSTKITDIVTLSRYLEGNFNRTELLSSIAFLSEKLHKHFDRKVQILIDDYDMPVINGHMSFFNHPDHRKFDLFQKMVIDMYNYAYKMNSNRNIGLVSGVFPPVKTTNFVLPVNPGPLDVVFKRPPFTQYYGYTPDEIQQILNKISFQIDPHKLQSWYGGYRVFGPDNFYNLRSVKRCLANNGTLKYYGSESNVTELVDTILSKDDTMETVQKLLLNASTSSRALCFTFADKQPLTWGDILPGLRTLFLSGYITAERDCASPPISIPNQETRSLLETKVVQWVSQKFCITPEQFSSFVAKIPQEQIYQFQDSLRVYLDAAASFYPLNEKSTPIFYPLLMIAIKNALSTSHYISSHKQLLGPDKMNDTLFLPIQGQSDAAIFITYKIIAEEQNLKSTAKSGLWDMYFRPYDSRWKPLSHIKKIIEICMVFYNEKVHVQFSIEKFRQS
ncbi:uncharacterized protein LOC135844025 [Planococcus citri]|uniref:uncharacterized protein LOC135844025 n=1 Tax=Planococcus citri TaxID=170843 RepID=UPI0031FA2E02